MRKEAAAMLLGYSTWGMPTVPIDIAIRHLARLGFDGMELTVIPRWVTELSTLDQAARQRIRMLLDETGLQLPAVAGHTSLLAQDPAEHAQNMRRLQGGVDLCVDLARHGEMPCLNTTAGAHPEDWGQLKEQLVERLHTLGVYAAERGVMVAIEPHVGSILDLPEKAIWVIEHVNLPNVRLNFDISHFNVIGLSIEQTVPLLVPYTVHTHVKDERGRAPQHEFLIPGEGEFDYVRYLKAMAAAGYTGFITVEISIMVQQRPGYDPLAAATQSYHVLHQAFERAGLSSGASGTGEPG